MINEGNNMKKFISILLALLMCASLLPAAAMAADIEGNYRLRWDMGTTANNPAYVEWHVDTQSLQVTYTDPYNFFQLRDASNPDRDQKSKLFIKEGGSWTEVPNVTSKIVGVADERSDTWDSEMFEGDAAYTGSPTYQTLFLQFFQNGKAFAFDGGVEYGAYFEIYTDGYPHGSMPDDIFGFSNPVTSSWALGEIGKAEKLGLIPDCLIDADLTKNITRAEFAAIAVKVYESMSGKTATPVAVNPFTDCRDAEVLKAYNIGAVNGTSATTFTPNALLTREQAATMLTRVYKAVTMDGWTLATDGQFTLNYTKGTPFADDANISAYAKDSVYFMSANGIINGVGDNKFAPRAVTNAEQAAGYAQATREAALLIAYRMVDKLQ